jgi:hypothetical protein
MGEIKDLKEDLWDFVSFKHLNSTWIKRDSYRKTYSQTIHEVWGTVKCSFGLHLELYYYNMVIKDIYTWFIKKPIIKSNLGKSIYEVCNFVEI